MSVAEVQNHQRIVNDLEVEDEHVRFALAGLYWPADTMHIQPKSDTLTDGRRLLHIRRERSTAMWR